MLADNNMYYLCTLINLLLIPKGRGVSSLTIMAKKQWHILWVIQQNYHKVKNKLKSFFKKNLTNCPQTQRKIVAAFSSTLSPNYFAWLLCGNLHPHSQPRIIKCIIYQAESAIFLCYFFKQNCILHCKLKCFLHLCINVIAE